jgi:hypothetical protein
MKIRFFINCVIASASRSSAERAQDYLTQTIRCKDLSGFCQRRVTAINRLNSLNGLCEWLCDGVKSVSNTGLNSIRRG